MIAHLLEQWRGVTHERGTGLLVLVGVTDMLSSLSARMALMALSIWRFQASGSVLEFVLAIVLGAFPMALLSPLAGVLADRYDRKLIIVVCDGAALLMLVTVGLLYRADALSVWHAYASLILMCTVLTFRDPAFSAAMGIVVPRQHLTRANGMVSMSRSLAMVGAPMLAGIAMQRWGLFWITILNVPVFVLAILSIWQVSVPRPEAAPAGSPKGTVWRDVKEALSYLRDSGGLLWLALYGVLLNLLGDMVAVLTQPLLLSTFSVATASFLLSVGGAGALLGGAAMMVAAPSRRLLAWMVTLDIAVGIATAALGASQAVALSSVAILTTATCISLSRACHTAYWQSVTPAALLGRVLSLNQMATSAVRPLAAIGAALLADHVFEPSMMAGGLLGESAGALIGTGKGRGIGLMYVLAGLGMAVLGLIALCHPVRRRLDRKSNEPAP
jgi:MFS family permease